MGSKDLHEKPFDKGTIAKLEVFEDYAQAWIPTFVMKGESTVHIFDFFAGPGYDCRNVPGSPIRLLIKIEEQLGNILKNRTKITLHLNEFEPNRKKQQKYNQLKQNCEHFISLQPKFKYFLTIKYYNKDAAELFQELISDIEKYPSLVYLDQNGIKFISKDYLQQLEKLKGTDFLFFVSSSYFKWLGTTKEFKRVLNFDPEELKNVKQSNIHRVVLDKIKSSLSKESELKLFPYSIKKGANIFGIIFGATHYRAVDKFLEISWKKNELNGEADFDIDEDISKGQLPIFGSKSLTKVEKFSQDLEELVLNGHIDNNVQALLYTYETGNFYRIANNILKSLKKRGKISYEGRTPGISYNMALKWDTKRKIIYSKKV